LINKNKVFSIGMYKILDEALDNAFDEAKRCHSQGSALKKITVRIDSEENSASIIDDGKGFVNGLKINKKTKVSNVETAFSFLGAGSNFENNEVEVNLIGANGVGISCTNILSDLFEVRTVVGAKLYAHSWEKFETTENNTKRKTASDRGTSIKFIPRESIFADQRWDKEILMTRMIFRNFVKNQDPRMEGTNLEFYFNDIKIDLDQTFFPEEALRWSTPTSNIVLWPSYNDSTSVSFVNGTYCSGVHQKMIQEHINEELFDSDVAHRFYDVCTIINISPKFAKFDTQNKTRLVTRRDELGKIVKLKLMKKDATEFRKSKFYIEIADDIAMFIHRGEVNKLKKKKRTSKLVISDKFLPSKYKENYFIVEGNCLDENQKIQILNVDSGTFFNKQIKDVELGDVVITHKDNMRPVINKFQSIKKKVVIKTSQGDLNCSKDHVWYVFNIITEKLEWKKTHEIDKKIHKLVKL